MFLAQFVCRTRSTTTFLKPSNCISEVEVFTPVSRPPTVIANNMNNLIHSSMLPTTTPPSLSRPSPAPLVQLPPPTTKEYRDPKSNILVSYKVTTN